MKLKTVSIRRRITAASFAALLAAANLCLPALLTSATELDVKPGATDLTAAASYNPATAPTTSDVTFNINNYAATTFTANTALSIGSIDDLDTAQALIITNAGSANDTLTLNTTANAVSGTAATDLLYVAAGSGTLTIQNGSKTLGLALGTTGSFDVGSGANLTISSIISNGAASTPTLGEVTISNTQYGLTKTGAGTLTLSGANTFGGASGTSITNGTTTTSSAAQSFTLAAGTLNINNSAALGNASNNFIIAGGTFDSTVSLITAAYATVLAGNATFTGTNALTLGAATRSLLLGGNFTLTTNSVTNALTVAAPVIGNFTLTKAGAGTLALSILPLNTAGINIAAGTLNFTMGTTTYALPIAGSSGGAFSYTGTGMLTLTGANTYDGPTNISNGGIVSVASLNSVSGGTTSSALGTPTTAANGTINLGSLTTAGTLRYTGAATSTDRTINLAGTTGGGVLDVEGSGGAINFTGGVTATGAGAKTLTLTGTSFGTRQGAVVGNGTGIISGVIGDSTSTDGGATAVAVAGGADWFLTGTNTYTGGTTITGGILNINGDAALGAIPGAAATNLTFRAATSGVSANTTITALQLASGAGNVTLNADRGIFVAGGTAEFDTNGSGNSLTIPGIISGGITTATSTASAAYALGAKTIAVSNGNSLFNVVGETISGPGIVPGTTVTAINASTLTLSTPTTGAGASGVTLTATALGGLLKAGPGILTLTGANTFVGNTTVTSEGQVSSAGFATSAPSTLVVSSNGTLGASTSVGAVNIYANSSLVLDYTGTNGVDRVPDGSSVTLNQAANLTLLGNATAATAETIGALTFGPGGSSVVLTPGSGQSLTLTAASLARSADANIDLFTGPNLGVTPAAGTSSTSVLFTIAPTLVGSGTAGGNTVGVLQGTYGIDTNTPTQPSFLTYDATAGLRLLTRAEQLTSTTGVTSASGVTTATNLRLNLTGATSIGTGTAAVQSLQIDNTSGTGYTVTNSVATGGFKSTAGYLFTGNSAITLTGNALSIVAGAENDIITTNTAGVTITAPLGTATTVTTTAIGGSGNIHIGTGVSGNTADYSTNQFLYGGTGTLQVAGRVNASTVLLYSGTTQLVTGGAFVGNAGTLSLYVAAGATLDLNGLGVSPNNLFDGGNLFNQSLNNGGTSTTVGGGTITNTNNTTSILNIGTFNTFPGFTGTVAGNVEIAVTGGNSAEYFFGNNTFTGGVNESSANAGAFLGFTQDAALGSITGAVPGTNDNILLSNGYLVLAGNFTVDKGRRIGIGPATGAAGLVYTGNITGPTNGTVNIASVIANAATAAGTANASMDNLTINTFGSATSSFPGGATSPGGTIALGSGTTILSGANTYNGTTTVGKGILGITTVNNIGDPTGSSLGVTTAAVGGGVVNIGSGGNTAELQYIGSQTNATTNRVLNLAGSAATAVVDASGTTPITFTGDMTANGAVGNKTLTLQGTNTGANTLSGVIPATSAGVSTLTTAFTAAVPITMIAVGTGTNFAVGDTITGTGIAAGTTIRAVGGTFVTLSQATMGAGVAGETLTGTGTSAQNGVVSVTKTGVGTWTLNGNNQYTGTTTVTQGTLILGGTNATPTATINGGTLVAAANGALSSATTITVNNGGSLLLSNAAATDRIANTMGVSLAGTFGRTGTGNITEGTGATSTAGAITGTSTTGMGLLTLTSNSNLDFGTGGVATLVFRDFSPAGHVLNILNFVSSAAGSFATGTSGTDGVDDRLIFEIDQTIDLAAFSFNGVPATEIYLDDVNGTSYGEIVPATVATAVPEPGTWAAGLVCVVAVAYSQRRRTRGLLAGAKK